MSATDRVRDLSQAIADDLDVELFDVEQAGGTLRVTLDRPGGVPLDVIAEATRRLSRALDEHDPVPGRYTLEVSSPGLERVLRTPDHWRWAVGRDVSVKLRADAATDGDRRLRGVVRDVDDRGVTLALSEPVGAERHLALDDIDKARTVFEWGPTPKKGGKQGQRKQPRAGKGDKANKGKGATTVAARASQGVDNGAGVETT